MNFYQMLKILVHMHLTLLKTWAINVAKKLFDSAKKTARDAIKTPSKREIQKTAGATGDLTGNKIADEITKASNGNLEKKKLKWSRDTKRKMYISRKKTTNYWLIKSSII